MRSFLLSTFLLLSTFCSGQKVDSLFAVFQKDITILQALNDGVVVLDEDTKENYYLLMNRSPPETLAKWMDHPHPAIRCHLFSGVVNKTEDEELINQLMERHQNDTTSFNLLSGSVVSKWTVKEYMETTLKFQGDQKFDYQKKLRKIRETPRLVLPGIRHGRMQPKDLVKLRKLEYNQVERQVVSFTFSFRREGEYSEELNSDSSMLTKPMQTALMELTPGDVFYLDNIKIKMPDGNLANAGSVRIAVE